MKNEQKIGLKFDDNKPDVGLIFEDFATALLEVAKVATFGAKKYDRHNWKEVNDAYQRYHAALGRHILENASGELYDKESELLHLAHAAWNALAILELTLRDNRGSTTERRDTGNSEVHASGNNPHKPSFKPAEKPVTKASLGEAFRKLSIESS